jgi:hypothetical protein
MKALEIQKTDDSPHIFLDKTNSQFIFTGRSLPEDVQEFYAPVLSWLDEYVQNPNKRSIVEFRIDYFNTASMKKFIDILFRFKEISKNNLNEVKIKWYFHEEDDDTLDAGQDLQEIVGLNFDMLKTN